MERGERNLYVSVRRVKGDQVVILEIKSRPGMHFSWLGAFLLSI